MLTSLARRPFLLVFAAYVLLALSTAGPRVKASATDSVTVVNTPDVRVTAISPSALRDLRQITPRFLRAKKRYAFTWNAGEPAQTYVVVAVEEGGWVGVVVSEIPQPEFITVNDPREIFWLNITHAFSIREIIPPDK